MLNLTYDLTHPYFNQGTRSFGMFAEAAYKDVYSLEELEDNIVAISYPDDESLLQGLKPKTVLGDGWESFHEIFVRTFGLHPNVNFVKVSVCKAGQIGVDFEGEDLKGNKATGQSKFVSRSNVHTPLEENDKMKLERCLIASQNDFSVDVNHYNNIHVFTNAIGIGDFTAKTLLKDKVTCINRAKIKELTDNNPIFWDNARKCIMNCSLNIQF